MKFARGKVSVGTDRPSSVKQTEEGYKLLCDKHLTSWTLKFKIMTCQHLTSIIKLATDQGIPITFQGIPWSKVTGVWVYFNCLFDQEKISKSIVLPNCVSWHEHIGTHDGSEAGFVCSSCGTGVMGVHPSSRSDVIKLPIIQDI